MENCIRSLLIGGEEVEILIIDDGSSDRTAEIADRLEKEHPGIVRAIHQINKGHGGAVNTGIENASGLYFKVVDSDDKVRASAYRSILDVLRRFSAVEGGETAAAEEEEEREEPIDLLISNFVYNKEDQNRHKVMEYRKCLPQNRLADSHIFNSSSSFRRGMDSAAPGRVTASAAARPARRMHSGSGRPAAIPAMKYPV